MDIHEQSPTTGDRAPLLASLAGLAALVGSYAIVMTSQVGEIVAFALAALLAVAALADARAARR